MNYNDTELMDPNECPFRETCPHIMSCVTEFLVEMARADWGLPPPEVDDED